MEQTIAVNGDGPDKTYVRASLAVDPNDVRA